MEASNKTTYGKRYEVLYRDFSDEKVRFHGVLVGGNLYSFTDKSTWVFIEDDGGYHIIPYTSILFMRKHEEEWVTL